MSTITKLDPRVRQRRYARKRVIGMVSRASDQLAVAGRATDAIRTAALATYLDDVRRAPNLGGYAKDYIFRRVANNFLKEAA